LAFARALCRPPHCRPFGAAPVYLHLSELPFGFSVHDPGVPDAFGNVAVPHCARTGRSVSRASVPVNGRCVASNAKLPFFPLTVNFTRPVSGASFMPTLTIPWKPPKFLLMYVNDVSFEFAFQPSLKNESYWNGGIDTS